MNKVRAVREGAERERGEPEWERGKGDEREAYTVSSGSVVLVGLWSHHSKGVQRELLCVALQCECAIRLKRVGYSTSGPQITMHAFHSLPSS